MGLKDLSGQRFGRLTVIDRAPGEPGVVQWNVRCDCGTDCVVRRGNLLGGKTNSCGCIRDENLVSRVRKHGHSSSRTYGSWLNARIRCLNPKATNYHNYGGRGITMCPRWLDSFENFLADMGECPEGLTLERKEVNGNYEPDNCEWATRKTQQLNRRANKQYLFEGQWVHLIHLCKLLPAKHHEARAVALSLPYRFVGTTHVFYPLSQPEI